MTKPARSPLLGLSAEEIDDVAGRLYAKVSQDAETGCCLWMAARKESGHGVMGVGNRVARVSRVVWELERGPIPPGMCVCHHCDNPPCVRMDHLFLGTPRDNVHDMIRKGRDRNMGTIHREQALCKNGHELTPAREGDHWRRRCKVCDNASRRKRYADGYRSPYNIREREKLRAQRKAYYLANRERINADKKAKREQKKLMMTLLVAMGGASGCQSVPA